ncbi:MAG: AbrB family transcriptional regulator, partial [Treponema sp.]|nr:AbrB family transcriptional regulator [Treponema sp.]
MAYLVLLHLAGIGGGLILKRLRVPAGALLGSMAFVIALNIITGHSHVYPTDLRRLVQVVSGAVIGLTFTRADAVTLHRLVKPVMILLAIMLSSNVLFAFIISRFTELDLITALFASAPGGVSDIALISADFGANTQQVAILQIFRFAFIVSLFPFIVRSLLKTQAGGKDPKNEAIRQDAQSSKPEKSKEPGSKKLARIVATLLTAGAGAALARWAGLPAGAMIGALAATVVMNTAFQAGYLPKWARMVVQIFAGCFIGSQITLATIAYLKPLLLPMALVIAQLMILTFGTAWILHRFCRIDRPTSLFCSIPGGTLEMSLIAQEM